MIEDDFSIPNHSTHFHYYHVQEKLAMILGIYYNTHSTHLAIGAFPASPPSSSVPPSWPTSLPLLALLPAVLLPYSVLIVVLQYVAFEYFFDALMWHVLYSIYNFVVLLPHCRH
mmetsp:Transcript_22910/g.29358  ORF Transcript_22910/g.29358 Transcript_22910/m.29358 type:complete len:114 (-) Transcript_22910:179-520(-)